MELDDRIAGLSEAKRELLARWLEGEAERRASAAYALPGTDAERTLAEIWQDVLEVSRVGVDDDYFELGGDSIHAIVIVGRAQQAGLQFDAPDLFEQRTVRRVAARATAAALPPAATLPPAAMPRPGAEQPLTPLQQGMLYHAVGGSTPGAYLVQLRCEITGELDLAAYRAAWRAVFAANPALHSVVRWTGGEQPRQRFDPGLVMPVEVVDHTGLAGPAADEAFARLLEDDRLRGFDLETGPLMRLVLVAEGPARHRCVWTYHHLIMDGWSQQRR